MSSPSWHGSGRVVADVMVAGAIPFSVTSHPLHLRVYDPGHACTIGSPHAKQSLGYIFSVMLEHAPIYSSLADGAPFMHRVTRIRADTAVEPHVSSCAAGLWVVRVVMVERILFVQIIYPRRKTTSLRSRMTFFLSASVIPPQKPWHSFFIA